MIYLHLPLVIAAFFLLLASLSVGVVFLLREAPLKEKRYSAFWSKLPPLEVLDRFQYRSLRVGFVLLTLSILTGAVWTHLRTGFFFNRDPKAIAAIVAWVVYAVLLNIRHRQGISPRRGVLLSLLGFAVIGMIFWFSVSR